MEVPASHLRFPLFDSLRALAAISILVVHVSLFTVFITGPDYTYLGGFLAHLDVGVPFFFLLSAFLLYRPFVAARVEGREEPGFGGYGWRRFLRIAPAYWAVLVLSAIVPGMAGAFGQNWWVYWGLLQNLPVYEPVGRCAVDSYRCAIPPAWSLSIEVMFYILLPLFVLGLAWIQRQRRSGSWLIPELAAISLLALVSLPIQASTPTTDFHTVLFFSPIGRGLWFALGLALASVSVWVHQQESEPVWVGTIRRTAWAFVGAAVALYLVISFWVLEPSPSAAFPLTNDGTYMVQYVAFGLIALLVILPATFGWQAGDRYRRFLRHKTTTWLGLISYGIFLWQFPALIFMLDLGALDWWPEMDFAVLLVTTFAVTIACAAASYYLLERPIMRWGRRMLARRRSLPVPDPAVAATEAASAPSSPPSSSA
ncbi:MAG: acyltransferase [Solirubrobacterales bacterium]